MNALSWLRKQPKAADGRWPLDLPLVHFSRNPSDCWTLRDSFEGVAIFGQTGSGKTTGSGRLLARKFLQNGFGGLIVCSKPEEAERWRNYLQQTGREEDGRFFSVDSDLRLNFIDHESKTSNLDFVENLVNLLTDVSSINNRAPEGPNQGFWVAEKKKLVRNAVSLLLLAGRPIEIRSLYDMIASSPKTAEQARSTDWRSSSYLFQLLTSAHKLNAKHEEFDMVDHYFMQERLELHGGTRGTVDAEFTGTFDALRRGKIGQLFGTTTTISPEDILAGRVVVVDVPVDVWREIGQYAGVIWIQMLTRAIDRRTYTPPESRPVFLWEDESHKFSIEQDAGFQSGARSKGIATVRITQGLPAYLDAYGHESRSKVDALLGAHGTKIFHRNDCPVTNDWASKIIAKEASFKHSITTPAAGGPNQVSVATERQDSCPPEQFLGLKNGGPKNKWVSEAILAQSGRMWLNNKVRWLITQWVQRHGQQS
jgi:hypothetical protein